MASRLKKLIFPSRFFRSRWIVVIYQRFVMFILYKVSTIAQMEQQYDLWYGSYKAIYLVPLKRFYFLGSLKNYVKIATRVVSTDIFKTAGIKSTKACYFIFILQPSVVSAFCFFTICKIEISIKKRAPHIFSIYLQDVECKFSGRSSKN